MDFGFIGTGSMVSAIVRGAHSGGIDTSHFLFANRSPEKSRQLAAEFGGESVTNRDVAARASFIVIGVKPQILPSVLNEITDTLCDRSCLPVLVSLAAGQTISSIRTLLIQNARHQEAAKALPIIRVMPNVNAQINMSMTGICHEKATEQQLSTVEHLMGSLGDTLLLNETDFPAFQALAGCAPAWVFHIIESLARAGVKHGLPKATAVSIAAQVLQGSAALVRTRAAGVEEFPGAVPTQLIDRVTSPGGTTIAGLLAAEQAGLSSSLVAAVDAAIKRDRDLA